MNEYTEANRARWDDLAAIHPDAPGYRTKEFLAGGSTLEPLDFEEVGDVAGKTLLHLQCHIGLDTLSWGRAGATVTGFDFSPVAIDQARRLSQQSGVAARFVLSSYDRLVDDLAGEQFDIVYMSRGVLCWLPEIAQPFDVAARLLKPGGTFHLIDGHPVKAILDDERPWPAPDAPRIIWSYFYTPEPQRWEAQGSYADRDAAIAHTTTYEWNYDLGTVISTAIGAGLRVVSLREFPFTFHQAVPTMWRDDAGRWRLPPALDGRLPLSFALKAVKEV